MFPSYMLEANLLITIEFLYFLIDLVTMSFTKLKPTRFILKHLY